MRVAFALRQRLARNFAPIFSRQVGEVPVAIRARVHAREVDPVCGGQSDLVDIGAADHHDLVGPARARHDPGERQGIRHAIRDRHPRRLKIGIARDDDVVAPIERLADGLKRAPAHDDGLAHCESPECFEIGR